ncbi:hypothetical protein [Nocardia sp. NPDC052566]|uniref:DUF7373 family lipoprotein n=1 Tax=Nocardia sp. NPDC052566 TaxID=3364330 RepID=UPI0037C67111
MTILAFAVTGCGAAVSGTAVRQETDLATLDVGNYQTRPRTIGNAKNLKQARVRESQRLSDFVALPSEADPGYVEDQTGGIRSHLVLNRKGMGDLVINDTFNDVAKDLLAGWVNAENTGGPSGDTPRRTLSIAVLEFPDARTAAEVGPVLEHDDFTYNPDNVPVELPKYPAAKAHWRPMVSSIGSWTMHERYVVFIKVVDDTTAPDLPALVAHTQRMLDVQLPLLDKFEPTPADRLKTIPLDPDGLLGRTLPTNPAFRYRPDPDGVYTGRGGLTGLDHATTRFLTDGDVDRIALGDTLVARSRTAGGALNAWRKLEAELREDQKRMPIDPPKGIRGNVVCFREPNPTYSLCAFQIDRYVVQAVSSQRQDIYQKISAQYALLTSR